MKERSTQVSKEFLKKLPTKPGVYLMKDEAGKVIYVGKAKNLKSRVRSYYSGNDSRLSIPYLLEKIFSIDTLVTENERQAIVLESDLIKKYKPRYNVRLKDDKAHFLVRIDLNSQWPRIERVRRVRQDGAKYIGPFAFSYELRAILEVIKRTVPLRTCADSVLKNRVRPCLEYQIKRCAAPCCLDVDPEEYRDWLKQAIKILEGKNKDVLVNLKEQMERASVELRFEDAAAIRDRINVLEKVTQDTQTTMFPSNSQDAFSMHREGNLAEISVLMVRQGRLFEAKSFGFSDVAVPDDDILSSVMSQFYSDTRDIPDEILIDFELEDASSREELYSEQRGKKTKVAIPQRGPKKRLVDLAKQNALENFQVRFAEQEVSVQPLKELQDLLSLEELPRTMECVDVSHFQGGETVASVVFFQDGKPDKSRYRHYVLKHQGTPDDFESMREVVIRHLSRAVEENTLCDLMVIDGGKGQLSQAVISRKEVSGGFPVMVGLAKARAGKASPRQESTGGVVERVFLEGAEEAIDLPLGSSSLHLMERIRDEAHRFAITHHRKRRSKRSMSSELDNIPGIGPSRRNKLLEEFGSVSGLQQAEPEEISERCRIPYALAESIVQFLNR